MDTLFTTEKDALSPRLSSKACPQCDGGVAIDSPHVRISRGAIRVYCSKRCLADAIAEVPKAGPAERERPRRNTKARASVVALGLGAAILSPCVLDRDTVDSELEFVQTAREAAIAAAASKEEPMYGPHPPTEEELAEEFAASLGTNGWVHPLPGPNRRMPIRKSRAFGADRPGRRPFECRSGHCGVDIGGAIWGEPILAASDAVVEKVNRDPGRSGGLYLRLSHNDGSVFTQYFHLAAIPKHMRQGKRVRVGETIGLLGETGVEHSGPHLHFTVSVKSAPESPEVYIDPEPLIALWPLRKLHEEVAAAAKPGVPIGATGRYKSRRRNPPKARSRKAELELAEQAPKQEVEQAPVSTAASEAAEVETPEPVP